MKLNVLFSILITVAIQSICKAEAGDSRYYYDANGNNIASSMSAGKNTFYYDGQGQDIGSSQSAGNTTYYYDDKGNIVGSSMSNGLNQRQ